MNLFTVHTKNGLYLYRCLPIKSEEKADSLTSSSSDEERTELINNFKPECIWSQTRPARHCVASLNNNLCVVDDRTGLSIVHMKSGHTDLTTDTLRGVGKFKNMYTPLGCKNIKHLQWSINGTYLVIYFHLTNSSDSGASMEDNLHIWDITKKSIVGTFSTRRLSPEQWPITKWLGGTHLFAFCHNHQINMYSIASETGALKTPKLLLSIPCAMVYTVEVFYGPSNPKNTHVSEGDKIHLASFSQPDSNHKSGSLRISNVVYRNETLVEVSSHVHELSSTDSAELLWSPSGNYLMVLAHSTVDQAGQKYGSTTNCLIYAADGRFLSKVNNATTHDARWNPKCDEFIILQGNMPCKITMYSATLEPLFEFPPMYRNTIKWNPMGNMVALGGFGNLAGEICFWYKRPGTLEMEQIVQFKEPCTVLTEWSLDSKYFMTASTYPRMKVDNFFKIFNTEGYLIASESLDECYHVSWFCGNADENDFTRPKVRKSLVRKPVYRPKLGLKTQKQPTTTNFSKAPGSPIFNPVKNGNDEESKTNTLKQRGPDGNWYVNGVSGSVFSNEFGGKCDPMTDLYHSFNNVFSLAHMRNHRNVGMEYQRPMNMMPEQMNRIPEQINRIPEQMNRMPEQINRMPEQASYRMPDYYVHELQRTSSRPSFTEERRVPFPEDVPYPYNDHGCQQFPDGRQPFQDERRHTYPESVRPTFQDGTRPPFQESARQPYSDKGRQGFQEDRRQQFGEGVRQPFQEDRHQFQVEEARQPQNEEPKNISMFVKLKNQLQLEKNRNSTPSILDEGQLLRLLLEAKSREKPDSAQSF